MKSSTFVQHTTMFYNIVQSFLIPKMCIKSAPYLHQKSANWALNSVPIYASVESCSLNSSQIAPLEGVVRA